MTVSKAYLSLGLAALLAACGGTATGSGQTSLQAKAGSSPAGGNGAGLTAAGSGSAQAGGQATAGNGQATAGNGQAAAGSASGQGGVQAESTSGAPASAALPKLVPDENAIRIGQMEPLSGELAVQGKDYQDGFNLYLASINNQVAGRKVQVMYVDEQDGAAGAKALVETGKVQLIAGLKGSAACQAVAGYAQQANVPLLVSDGCPTAGLLAGHPSLARISQTPLEYADAAADWMYKQGYHKVDLLTIDSPDGIEASDAFATAFIEHGGSILQEIHPPAGAAQVAAFVTMLYPAADAIATFVPDSDAAKMLDVYGSLSAPKKPPLVDFAGLDLASLGVKAADMVGIGPYSPAADDPANHAFLQAWQAKYPSRPASQEAAQGYSAAHFIATALNTVGGKADDKEALLNAIYSTKVNTASGPLALDKDHDVVRNVYVDGLQKSGSGYAPTLLDTFKALAPGWDRAPGETAKLKLGSGKNRWVSVTKPQLATIFGG